MEAPPHVEARRLQGGAGVEGSEGAEGPRGVGMATALATAIAHSLTTPHPSAAREGTDAPTVSAAARGARKPKDVVLYSGVILTFGVMVTSVVVDVSAILEVSAIRAPLLPQALYLALLAAIHGACFRPTLCPPTNCSASHLVNDN